MSTIEKLVAQIFERKKSIIEQVRHRVELYDQQLASKCILDGIEPPSWLWNHQASDSRSSKSNPSEIKKRKLIKELLLPYPQHVIPSFGEFTFDSTSIPAFNYDLLDEPQNRVCVDEVSNVPDVASELEPSASSPQNQVAARSGDINVSGLSRPEFKRSKSRQRALELRSSAKSGPKRHFQDEKISGSRSRESTPHMHDSVQRNNAVIQESNIACSFHFEDGASAKSKGVAIQCSEKNRAAGSLPTQIVDHVCDSVDRVCIRRSVAAISFGQVDNSHLSDDLPVNHREGAAVSQELKTQQCKENKASDSVSTQTLNHLCDYVDSACIISSSALSSGQVNNSILPDDTVDNHHERDAECSRIKIRSYRENEDSKSTPDQIFDHMLVAVDHACKSDSVGALPSERISHSVQPHETLIGRLVGDTSSDNMKIQTYKENNGSDSVQIQKFDQVCDSSNHVCRSISIHQCYKDNKACVLVPTQKFDHVCDSIGHVCKHKSSSPSPGRQIDDTILHRGFLDSHHEDDPELKGADGPCCKESTAVLSDTSLDLAPPVMTLGCIDCELNEARFEMPSQTQSHLAGTFSYGIKEGDINRISSSFNTLQDHDQVQEPRISTSPSGVLACKEESNYDYSCSLAGTKSSGAKSLKLETSSAIPEGCNTLLGKLEMHDKEALLLCRQSANVELPYQQMEEASPVLQAEQFIVDGMVEEGVKQIVGSQLEKAESNVQGKHGLLLEPAPISFQRSSSIISMEGSRPQHKHTTREDQPNHGSSGPTEFTNSLANASNACSSVDADNSACEFDYLLLQKDLHDQANSSGIQICSYLPSLFIQNPSDILLKEDNIALEGIAETAATESLVEASASSVNTMMSKVITECTQMNLSEQAEEPTDRMLMMEKKTKCPIDDIHLIQDQEAKLVEGHAENDTFSDGKEQPRGSYRTDFEGNGFEDALHIDMIETDQIMPVIEGFFMDSDDGDSCFAEAGINFEDIPRLPDSAIKRVNILERLCPSASKNTPLSDFPMTYRLHKTSDPYQSVPIRLLEHMPLVSDNGSIQFPQKPHSASLPVSGGPFSFNVETPYVSPVRKLWDRSSSNSSFKKQQYSNPELVCFTIEEDPGNCEEIGICEEVAEACSKSVLNRNPLSNIFPVKEDPGNFEEIATDEEIAEAPISEISLLKRSPLRKPLSDITENCENPLVSVSSTVQFQFRSHKDSTSSEANITGARSKVKQKLESKFSNKNRLKNDATENNKFSVGGNGVKRDAELKRETRSQKPKLSEIPYTVAGTSYTQKLPRPNNIVSNMTSFVPLVQEKKAAVAATGKRDVKVKALEAAEAAKRLEAKKENERRMKKEAWKAEKARLEQENLLQLEVQKKKKEDEQKKKEAEMAARKRQREEEEKKEKEGKRRRFEEARKQQQEKEKKLQLLAKETRHQAAAGRRVHEKKELGSEICGDKARINIEGEKGVLNPKGSHFLKMTFGDGGSLKMLVDEPGIHDEKNLRTKVEPSYEISPYQGSDDEYEVDDDGSDIRKEKFVPAWASKISRAEAIFAQKHINPFEIFPPESFCSISEVLVPRKLQAKLRGK